ncbi:YunC family protein [Candidatus Pyrohabitans sp.]
MPPAISQSVVEGGLLRAKPGVAMEIEKIALEKGTAIGLRVLLGKAPLIVIKAERGYLMCGYLNTEVAEKLGDAAAVVRGVNTFDEMLEKEVSEVTGAAEALGIRRGMKGVEALERML